MAHRLSSRAEADLDDIWYYVAKQSGSIEVANWLIESISDRFLVLAKSPYLGRARDEDFGYGTRSFAVGDYVIVYCLNDEDVLILRVVHGRRDIEALFGR
jgi:toxin ParE1/3/4